MRYIVGATTGHVCCPAQQLEHRDPTGASTKTRERRAVGMQHDRYGNGSDGSLVAQVRNAEHGLVRSSSIRTSDSETLDHHSKSMIRIQDLERMYLLWIAQTLVSLTGA